MSVPHGGGRQIWRDLDGGNIHKPDKGDIRNWAAWLEERSLSAAPMIAFSDFNAVPLSRVRQVVELPLKWANEASGSWYPQGFSYDAGGWLIIHYADYTGAISAHDIAVIYDATYAYQTWIRIPRGGESIVATGAINDSDLKLYCRLSSGESLVEVDVGALPATGADYTVHTVKVPSGVGSQFACDGKTWLIEQSSVDLGVTASRTKWNIYDASFAQVGSIDIPINVVGFQAPSSPHYAYVPKSQGIAIRDGEVFCATGGSWIRAVDGAVAPTVADLGVVRLGPQGGIREYAVTQAESVADLWTAVGITHTRTENEGCTFHPISGELHTLNVSLRPSDAASATHGVVIMSHGDAKGDDWSSYASDYWPVDLSRLTAGMLPRGVSGKFENPLTGAQVLNMDDLLDFMVDMQLSRCAFFSASHGISPIPTLGVPASGNYHVELLNANGASFDCKVTASTAAPNAVEFFQIYKSAGAWTAVLRGRLSTVAALPLASIAGRRSIVSDATSAAFGSVVVGGGSTVVPVYSDGASWRVG